MEKTIKKTLQAMKARLTREINEQMDYLNEMLGCAYEQPTFSDGKGRFWYHGNILTDRDVRREMRELNELQRRKNEIVSAISSQL